MAVKKQKISEGQLIAQARDEFFRENNLLETQTGGQFLKNRLERAFIAGWNAATKECMKIDWKKVWKEFDLSYPNMIFLTKNWHIIKVKIRQLVEEQLK